MQIQIRINTFFCSPVGIFDLQAGLTKTWTEKKTLWLEKIGGRACNREETTKDTMLASINTSKKLLITQIHECSLMNSWYVFLRIFINWIFDFPTTLLITKIDLSHLNYLPTFLVLKHLYFLSTSFLTYGFFCKSCSTLQELSNGI